MNTFIGPLLIDQIAKSAIIHSRLYIQLTCLKKLREWYYLLNVIQKKLAFRKSCHSEVISRFPKNLTLILWNRGSSLLNWWDKNMIEFLWNASFHKIFVYKESNIFQNKRTLQTEKAVSIRHGAERRFIRTAYFMRNPIPQHEFYMEYSQNFA